MTTGTIVVGVDGSDQNKKVLKQAAAAADSKDTRLVLVHAITPHALAPAEIAYAQERCGKKFAQKLLESGLPAFPVDENTERRSVHQYLQAREAFNQVYAEDALARAEDQLRQLGVDNIKTVIENASPAKAILDVAEREKADLIIIGRRGHNRLVEFILGSTAQKVLQQSTRSVLAVE